MAVAIFCAVIAGVALALPTLESTGDSEHPSRALDKGEFYYGSGD